MAFSEAEIKKLKKKYDGTYASIIELVKEHDVDKTRILWAVDHKDFRAKHRAWLKDWKKRNPEKAREIDERARKKFYSNPANRKKYNEKRRKLYYKDVEKSREYYRNLYYKHRDKRLKYLKEYHKKQNDKKRENYFESS
jgi:hypothetical protein